MNKYVNVGKLISRLSGTISVRQLDMIKAVIYSVGVEELLITNENPKPVMQDDLIRALQLCSGASCDGCVYRNNFPKECINKMTSDGQNLSSIKR